MSSVAIEQRGFFIIISTLIFAAQNQAILSVVYFFELT